MADYPDFEGDKSGLYLKPEWAAKEGTDKTIGTSGDDLSGWGGVSAEYTVPAGKTLYIVAVSGWNMPLVAAEYDHHYHMKLMVGDITAGTTLLFIGGESGIGLTLDKPIVIPASHLVRVNGLNRANLSADLAVCIWGYEV